MEKRNYVKPSFLVYAIEANKIMTSSNIGGEIIIDTPEELTMFLNPSCTAGGNGLQLDPGVCNTVIAKDLSTNENNGCNFWTPDLIKQLGLPENDYGGYGLELCRDKENTDLYRVRLYPAYDKIN